MYYGNEKDSNNDIKHFGVLGMRWGVRHDKQYQAKERSARGKKNYNSIVKKAKLDTANRLYSKNTSKMNNSIVNASTGETLVKSFLMGSYGSMKYAKAKSEGSGTASAAVNGILMNWGNNLLYNVPSLIEYADNRSARKSNASSKKK